MSLASGTKLAHYEILEPIGKGGMGDVYRARDSKLGREVAVKVLPDAFAQDTERLARFQREAKVLAALNHPNIAHVYGFESSALADGSTAHFLAMELVPGEDLAERLARGPIPVEDALEIAKQLVAALEEAHEKGIVHRDLKPANVKLTADGKVKVLDFGLAKAYAGDARSASGPDLSQSPTLAHTATQAGVILGTASYMSPEQARGKPVDKRADIWAFGVVLLEMLTGRRLFTGDTVSDILAEVLKSDIDLTSLPDSTPPAARHTLRRCLERDPQKRLRDIGDVELEGALESRATEPPASRSRFRTLAPWTAAVVLAVAWLLTRPDPPAPAPVSRTTIALPRGLSLPRRDRAVAISPDGTELAVVLEDASSTRQLYVRPLDGLDTRALEGTDDASYPFWSPDGRALGFFAHDELRRFDLPDGPVRTLSPALSGRGASWGKGDTIVFAAAEGERRQTVRLYRVSAANPGTPEPIGPDPGAPATTIAGSRLPLFLPDGTLLFNHEQRVFALNGTSVEPISGGDVLGEVQYVPPGYLASVRDGLVMVQRFDLGKRILLGSVQVLADRVRWDDLRRTGHFSFSTSAFVYLRTVPEPLRRLTWFDPEGRPLETVGEPGQVVEVAPSPDGTRALVTLVDGASRPDPQLWMVDLRSGLRSPFTRASELGDEPVWSRDGRRIAFRGRDDDLVIRSADGASPPDVTFEGPNSTSPSGWSLDGSEVILGLYRGVKGFDLAKLSADGKEEPELILDTPAQEFGGALSPDGNWLAYVSNESGQDELYLTRYPDLGRRWPLTGGGLRAFQWTGPSELLYTDPAGLVYTLSFHEDATGLELAPRQPSFGGKVLPGPSAFVPARDRFLVAVPVPGQDTEDSLVLVTNWQSALK